MQSRERVERALNHLPTDRVPIDLGSTAVTGAHVSIIHQLRQSLGLPVSGEHTVRVADPYQMLGRVENDLRDAIGVDCIGVGLTRDLFGFRHDRGWKPFVAWDGVPMLVPDDFNTEFREDGALLQYPQGDRSAPASGIMPAGGYFHDTIIRQPPIDDDHLNVEDNLEEFQPLTDEDLEHLRRTVDHLYNTTPYAIVGNFGQGAFGDIALVPAPFLKYPKGIRDVQEWYTSLLIRQDYILELFDRQCAIAIKNLEMVYQAVGNKVSVVFVSGTDFGTQNAPFMSNDQYKTMFQPFHQRVNGWVHQHTAWKTFIHSCGAIEPLISEIITSGFDILNPVQCSACGMDPQMLKDKYGAQLTFWGGGIDTQKTLPYGTLDAVKAEVAERVQIFGANGGFIFNPVHNIQALSPIESVLAMYEVVKNTRLPQPAAV